MLRIFCRLVLCFKIELLIFFLMQVEITDLLFLLLIAAWK